MYTYCQTSTFKFPVKKKYHLNIHWILQKVILREILFFRNKTEKSRAKLLPVVVASAHNIVVSSILEFLRLLVQRGAGQSRQKEVSAFQWHRLVVLILQRCSGCRLEIRVAEFRDHDRNVHAKIHQRFSTGPEGNVDDVFKNPGSNETRQLGVFAGWKSCAKDAEMETQRLQDSSKRAGC